MNTESKFVCLLLKPFLGLLRLFVQTFAARPEEDTLDHMNITI